LLETGERRQVRETIQRAIDGACLPGSFRELLYIPLRQRGKAFSADQEPRWPTLVLHIAAAARGPVVPAIQVAAAVEVFMAALDVMDEIQDGDPSPLIESAGIGQAVGVAGALLVVAYDMLARLPEVGISATRVPEFVHTLARCALAAGGGQHLDLAAEGRSDISLDDALQISRMKGGMLAAAACRLGALVATNDEDVLCLYESLGYHLGTIEQLANDLEDAARDSAKTDRVRQKRTLPLLYNSRRSEPSSDDHEACFFAQVVIESERERVRQILDQLAARQHAVESLAALVTLN
jgi:Geranylgeranyl pyrophosphate synthase